MKGSLFSSLITLLFGALMLGVAPRAQGALTVTTETVAVVGTGPLFITSDFPSLALDASGNPHISFVDWNNQLFVYGTKSGGSWTFETIAPNGFDPIFGDPSVFTSIAVDASGNPHVAFWDPEPNVLQYASRLGGVWTIETADNVPNNGRSCSLVLDASGNPHISYYDQTNNDLRYAAKSGGVWTTETVDSAGIFQPGPQSLALDALGNPHISYLDFTNGTLKYASKSGGVWTLEVVPGSSTTNPGSSIPNSIVMDATGHPHIAYIKDLITLIHATKSGASWISEPVDPGPRSFDPSIELNSSGVPCISYFDRSVGASNLKYATKSGGVWTNQVIDAPGNVGQRSSLALDASGNPHIVYRDATNPVAANRTLKYASGESSGGNISGTLLADCPAAGSPLLGVTLDAFVVGSGILAGTAVTNSNGSYTFEQLAADDYNVVVVTPLGYTATPPEQVVTVVNSQTTTLNVALHCQASSGDIQASGFWKHEVGVATTGKGSAHVDAATLCGYLDLIASHFNSNQVNPVVVYVPPASGDCDDKLNVAATLLNLQGPVAMQDRARQQLLALLLNVASGRLGTMSSISVDGATVSQAITYCDNLIDNPSGDYERAKTIAEDINNGKKVAAGRIPLSTAQIAYRHRLALSTFTVSPNPGLAARTFSFTMGEAGSARLTVYDVAGRLVANLLDGPIAAGPHSFSWTGAPRGGDHALRGIFFARLDTGDDSRTIKIVQLMH